MDFFSFYNQVIPKKQNKQKTSLVCTCVVYRWLPLFTLQIHITQYADSVACHLAKILDSDKHSDVISSAKYVPRIPALKQEHS